MLKRLIGNVRPEFVSSLMKFARDNKKPDIDRLPIPNEHFENHDYITKLFLNAGRVVKHIDTTTFNGKVVVAIEGGEVWSARKNRAGPKSMFVIRLTDFEMQEFEQQV